MSEIVYPSHLPCPTSLSVEPSERRYLSELPGPRTSRVVSVDKVRGQPLVFLFRTRALLQDWLDWYKLTLSEGAAWFAASWPQPEGGVGVRRFIGTPSYPEYFPKRGLWRVVAQCQVRGHGEMPNYFSPPPPICWENQDGGFSAWPSMLLCFKDMLTAMLTDAALFEGINFSVDYSNNSCTWQQTTGGFIHPPVTWFYITRLDV